MQFPPHELVAPLVEVSSGESEDAFWLSIGFNSPDRDLDALHIECGKLGDPCPGFQGLFLERSDQDESEYDLLEKLVVFANALQIELNDRGIKILGLPRRLRLPSATPIPAAVISTLRAMAQTPNGAVIAFDPSGY